MLLALDPGTNSPGLALFNDAGVLVAADRANVSEYAGMPDGLRWMHIGHCLAAWCLPRVPHDDELLTVVFERPQWYARGKSKGDPNQLAGLTGVAGVMIGVLMCRWKLFVGSPKPAEWIGQVPKTCATCRANKKKCPDCKGSAWNTPRGRRIRSRLSPAELALVPDQNDAIDAVGLGLFDLGRLTPRSVLSNGRDGR